MLTIKLENPNILHFHVFLVCKAVAYIEKRRQHVTPDWFFLVNLLWLIVFLSFLFLSLEREGNIHANLDCTFCLFREYLGTLSSLLARVR